MAKKLDIILFGVTGFTGLRTIPYITNAIKQYNLSLTWGVAGRSEMKIKRMLKDFGQKKGTNYDSVPIILADVEDYKSIKNMTAKARVIINATGPYCLYGEQVIKACLETGTHHVDVSGETVFIEKMQLLYHEEAKSKGVYIVSACGMDSIPVDMGVVYLKKNFEGTLNSVETFMYTTVNDVYKGGPMVNTGTFYSLVLAMSKFYETLTQRKLLFKNKLPSVQPKMTKRNIHKSELINRWCTAVSEPDLAVANRSQRFFYELFNERPIQISCYIGFESFFQMMLIMIGVFWIAVLSQFSLTRNLLLKYPKFFTLGVFSPEGPSDVRQEATMYNLKLRGIGWPNKLQDPIRQPDSTPNKEIVAKVSGKNPGYGLTCAGFALSAVMILTEADKMPDKGGVYPPGVAFAKTSIIEKLQDNGVKFELLKN